ncbi:hypothetical protein BKA66DRAFT_552991 [Pyrenochaeta sp. MPI-SDFR-AT-0127]|nr:hypothetical protein BKA66DRAFT_552991 [Pyrenochaeta sp. MPI-SDFR-AT-0127]
MALLEEHYEFSPGRFAPLTVAMAGCLRKIPRSPPCIDHTERLSAASQTAQSLPVGMRRTGNHDLQGRTCVEGRKVVFIFKRQRSTILSSFPSRSILLAEQAIPFLRIRHTRHLLPCKAEARAALGMDSIAGAPSSMQGNASHTWQHYGVAERSSEVDNMYLPLDSTFPAQNMDVQRNNEQGQASHTLSTAPYSLVLPNVPHHVELFHDAQFTPTASMGPPSRRKKKAPTLRASDWEPYKDRVLELHINQGLSLKEVKKKLEEEFGFTAEIRQYRLRISQWKEDKNIKSEEMVAIVRKRQYRKLNEPNKGEQIFTVRGRTVEPDKINRWMKRNDVLETSVYAPSSVAATPSAVGCRTNSERGSPLPSPMSSAATPAFSSRGITPVPQSLQIFSPALSIASIVQPQASGFTGQSPAPTYRPLPSLGLDPTPAADGGSMEMDITADHIQEKYKQKEEDTLRVNLSDAEMLYGMGHPNTLDILFDLGYVLLGQGRLKSAEKVAHRVVEGRRALNREDDPMTFDALALLARVLQDQGNYEKAERLVRRVFEFRKWSLGTEHPDTLTSMNNLASLYQEQGRWTEAEELGVRVLETRKRVLGSEHPATLTSMGNLVLVYQEQGRWKEAEELGVQVLETRKRVLGSEHPYTLTSMGNLVLVYQEQGRWKEAEELGVQDLETCKRVLGSEHPATLASMNNLALLYQEQGRWTEAEELGVRVLETRKRVLGSEHPYTLTSMGNLASMYQEQGRWIEAEELGVQDLETCKRVLGSEHPDTLASMNNLVLVYQEQGRWTEAEELGVRVLETRKRVLRSEHPDTLKSMNNLALVYQEQGRWTEAEELGVRVLETRKRVLGSEHPYTLTSMGNLASMYQEQGRWKEAEELGVQVLETRKRVLRSEHPDTLKSMNNLALVYQEQGRWTEAEELGVRVLETRKRVLGSEHPSTLTSMYNLSVIFKSQGSLARAISLLEESWHLQERVLGSEHRKTKLSLDWLSRWRSESV